MIVGPLAQPKAGLRADVFLIYLFIFIFSDFCLTNYLNIYWADLRQISRVGRAVAVDERSEVSFSTPLWTLPWQPIFVGFTGFYPGNWVRVRIAGWRRTTRSANAALDASD